MKKLFFIPLFIIISFVSFSQDNEVKFPTDSSGNVVFTDIIKGLDGNSANELYSRAKIFVAKTFVSNKDVTQLNDDATKTILIKPHIPNTRPNMFGPQPYGYTSYSLLIECKETKYRYTFNSFYHHGGYITADNYLNDGGIINQDKPSGFYRPNWRSVQHQDFDEITGLISSLKTAMLKKTDDF